MNRVKFGPTDLMVSPIGVGCMSMSGGYGAQDDAECIATIHEAIGLGINLFDTSSNYGEGHNHELIGKAIKGRRDEVVIHSKLGTVRVDGKQVAGTPEHIRASTEGGLKRLGIDCMDVICISRIDPNLPVEDQVGAMAQMVKEGKFREDLFFRLNVVRITMPPLRERTDDIPVLLEHFIKMYAAENAYEPVLIESGAMQHLQRYPWPGNIRELRNFSENAVVLRRGGKITEFDLEPKFRGEVAPPPSLQTPSPANPYSVEAHAKILLREALMKARGNRTKAAQLLGISRRTLHRKLAQSPELDVLDRG